MRNIITLAFVCLAAGALSAQSVPLTDPQAPVIDFGALDLSGTASPIDPRLVSSTGTRSTSASASIETLLADKGSRGASGIVAFGPPCTIPTCTGTSENETCGTSSNDGCVLDFCTPAAFVDATAGGTWCGTVWADGGVRDLDYYSITVASVTVLSATLNSGLPTNLILVESTGGANCNALLVTETADGGGCTPVNVARTLQAGTYYVVVTTGDAAGPIFDGFPCQPGPSQNNYRLDIALTSADCLTCTGTAEVEACGQATNEGCNAAAPAAGSYQNITVNGTTICGSTRTFVDTVTGNLARDTDWYNISSLVSTPGAKDVTVQFTAEFPGTAFIIQDTGGVASCTTLLLAGDEVFSDSCTQSTGVFTINGGGTFYLFVSTGDEFGAIFTGIGDCTDPANNYRITVTAAPSACPSLCALPGAGTPEGEPCPANPFDPDNFNGGCNATILPLAFSPISLGTTVSGGTWADSGTRDTDWHRFTATGPATTLTLTLQSQIACALIVISDQNAPGAIDVGGCNITGPAILAAANIPAGCVATNLNVNINPSAGIGGQADYVIFVSPGTTTTGTFSGFPCVCDFGYELTVSTPGATCQFPTGICDSDCVTGQLVFPLQAPAGVAYTNVAIEVFDLDGVSVGIANSGAVAAGAAFNMTFDPPADGIYNIELTANCVGGGTDEAVCTTWVYQLVTGTTDIVFDGDQAGCNSSGEAIRDALVANGRTVTYVNNLVQTIDTYDCLLSAGNIWVALGTFPNNVPMLAGEGTALANGILTDEFNVYVEGGDVWGFDVPTGFFEVDGVLGVEVDGNLAADGDDSFEFMAGNAGSLINTSGFALPLAYNQDNQNPAFGGGNDFTDQLALATGGDQPGGSVVEAIWNNDDVGNPYIVAIAKSGPDDSTGRVIDHTYEFGGFTANQNTLMGLYLGFFGGAAGENCTNGIDDDGDSLTDCADPNCFGTPACPQFKRGDCNADGLFNIADPIFALGILFPGGGPPNVPQCQDSCDSNDDGAINIADPIASLGVQFPTGSPPPTLPAPFPGCGSDPTADSFGCANYLLCP